MCWWWIAAWHQRDRSIVPCIKSRPLSFFPQLQHTSKSYCVGHSAVSGKLDRLMWPTWAMLRISFVILSATAWIHWSVRTSTSSPGDLWHMPDCESWVELSQCALSGLTLWKGIALFTLTELAGLQATGFCFSAAMFWSSDDSWWLDLGTPRLLSAKSQPKMFSEWVIFP